MAVDPGKVMLEHYGVLGMRWGVRKQDDGSYAKTGSPSDSSTGYNPKNPGKRAASSASVRGLATNREEKKQLKSWSKSPNRVKLKDIDPKAREAGYKKAQEQLRKEVGSVKLKPVVKKYSGNVNFKKNESLSNPKASVQELKHNVVDKVNPDFGQPGTIDNCLRATFTYEMRRRGYDVEVTRSDGQDQNPLSIYNALTKGKQYVDTTDETSIKIIGDKKLSEQPVYEIHSEYENNASFGNLFSNNVAAKDMFKKLEGQPDRSRGDLQIVGFDGSKHSIAYEIVDGSPVMLDTQNGQIYTRPKDFRNYMAPIGLMTFARLDNKELNMDQMNKWVKNAR